VRPSGRQSRRCCCCWCSASTQAAADCAGGVPSRRGAADRCWCSALPCHARLYRQPAYLPVCLPAYPSGAALSLLLVFRTNASYARFCEARQLWGAVVKLARDWLRLTAAYLPPSELPRAAALVQAFCWTLKVSACRQAGRQAHSDGHKDRQTDDGRTDGRMGRWPAFTRGGDVCTKTLTVIFPPNLGP
jgi:Bestrophin, RFP-TM, chloride channel